MYYLYHIPGKKIGVTTNLAERVENQQGYNPDEYEVIMSTEDIDFISNEEIKLQKSMGYRVDRQLYKDLYNNNFKQLNNMNINVTEMTTTFPCPVNKLKGRLMDEIGMQWETDHGSCGITNKSIEWIMDNVKSSQYTQDRCYIYNKAFARYFDNNDAYNHHVLDNAKQMVDQYNGRCRSGALAPTGVRQEKCKDDCTCMNPTHFDLIREWAKERGLYDKGDTKTQTLKLMEEAGEICRAVLKEDHGEVIDGIGDCVVVLTNLAKLQGTTIEHCIHVAYNVISERKGKMVNGTFKKD
jgi:NTP pyrophosphatase (non-canonical NTP hydrolase)